MKRVLSCILSVVLVVGLLPTPSHAYGKDLAADSLLATVSDGVSEWVPAETTAQAHALEALCDGFTASRVGIGGHGALFHPVISPFDHDTMIASCDMGGLYVTHDAGSNWKAFSLGGRVLTTAADPGASGVLYAGGSGLWRTADNGASWNLIWPKPANAAGNVQTASSQSRTFYFTSALDSYPDQNAVLAVCIDPVDSDHIVAVCASGIGGYVGTHSLCESFDGGDSFQVSARFNVSKKPKDTSLENMRVFVEPADAGGSRASRIVVAVPDGLLALDRANADPVSAMRTVYSVPGTVQDAAQVFEGGKAHYVVLENLAEPRLAKSGTGAQGAGALPATNVALWHATLTASSSDPAISGAVDLTDEMLASLPWRYNSKKGGSGDDYEIKRHDAVTLCVPSLSRIYLGYRSRGKDNLTNPSGESWQGVSGLVTYDATRPQGEQFEWVYGHRCYWNRADAGKRIAANQNHIMSHLASRGHVNANFTMLGLAADPRDDRRILMTTHTGAFYSPDIDADVGLAIKVDGEPRVNIYARYATLCEDDQTNRGRASNQNEYRMRSTGLEVTVAYHVRTDPFDESHVVICLDDAGVAHSYDGGETWSHFYTKLPKIGDCCFDAVFDEGREGVVYGAWDEKGAGTYNPQSRFYEGKSVFALSTDGGVSWSESYSTGLPDNAAVVKIAVSYPRDSDGKVADGDRTIYVATMGYGFYVSRNSGRTFAPMNAGIDAVSYTTGGVEYQAIWARDLLSADDGRLFGMTQYSTLGQKVNGSSTNHSTQDARTFGNVWEWNPNADGGAGEWVRLPFNYAGAHEAGSVDVRQPRSFAYDAETRTLYVAAVGVIGSYVSNVRWSNFGGGLYAYAGDAVGTAGSGSVKRVDAPTCSDVCGDNLVGVGFDAAGRMWLASEDGDVYYRAGRSAGTSAEPGWTQVFANALRICEGFDFDADGDVYLSTHGMSAIRFRPQALPESESDQGQTDPDHGQTNPDPGQDQTKPDQEQVGPGQGEVDPVPEDPGSGKNQPGDAHDPDADSSNPDGGAPSAFDESSGGSASKPDGSDSSGTGGSSVSAGVSAKPVVTVPVRPVYRMAKAKTGQRRYVLSAGAARNLSRAHWRYEGVAFFVPARGGKPVYQLKRAGRYTYTAKPAEVRKLRRAGWTSKKVAFHALESGGKKVYRLRNKATGAYLLTNSAKEVRAFKRTGWKSQGVVFRVVS